MDAIWLFITCSVFKKKVIILIEIYVMLCLSWGSYERIEFICQTLLYLKVKVSIKQDLQGLVDFLNECLKDE